MIGVQYLLAKKYAIAFVNVFGNQVTEQLCTELAAIRNLLTERHELLYIASLPQVPDDTKKRALQLILPEELFKMLITLIIVHKRILLLPEILNQIIMEYRRKNDIEHFIITSSHQLPLESLDILVQFLAAHTHHVVTYEHALDASLIAGIRMQSNIHLWEYSIQKQLQHMRGMLIS